MSCHCTFTVLFNKPFWIGIYERNYDNNYEVAKVTFGTQEPTNKEVFEFLLNNYNSFVFSKPSNDFKIKKQSSNPKKKQRKIQKELEKTGIGTKAQIELKNQYEKSKLENKAKARTDKKTQDKFKYELKKKKRKNKHKGK